MSESCTGRRGGEVREMSGERRSRSAAEALSPQPARATLPSTLPVSALVGVMDEPLPLTIPDEPVPVAVTLNALDVTVPK